MAAAALVLGLISLVCAVISWFAIYWLCIIALILGIVAIVLASKAKKACVAAGQPTGKATAGFVCGLLGLIFGAIGCVIWISCVICASAVLSGAGII